MSSAFELLDDIAEQLEHDPRGGKVDAKPSATTVQFSPPVVPVHESPEFKVLQNIMANLDQEFKRFKATITGLVHVEINVNFQANLFNGASPFQVNLAQPTIGFLRAWSTDPSALGDKLSSALADASRRIQQIEQALSTLQQGSLGSSGMLTQGSAGGAIHSPFGWNGLLSTVQTSNLAAPSGGAAFPPASGSAPVNSKFEAEIREGLRATNEALDTICDQLEADSVDIGTETFKSKTECATWLSTHNATSSVYLFVDAVSFLSLCTCDAHKSEQDAALS
ncbi:hypothetical protein ACA910_010556 [Epithemia clementina (nom. ined.)]